MALSKPIRQENGVTTAYHRILYLTLTTNRQNSIAVASYVDQQARLEEQADSSRRPFMEGKTYETAYDESMTVESAYDYLKTLPEFEGAVDI